MNHAVDALETAIQQAEKLRQVLRRGKSAQVGSSEDRGIAKATASAWFKNHRPKIYGAIDENALFSVDGLYQIIFESSDRYGSRAKYLTTLKELKNALIRLRSEVVAGSTSPRTDNEPPDFSLLVSDTGFQAMLTERWTECCVCIEAKAPLAATVMMGGLLEALLFARIDKEADKAPLFKAKSTPKNPKTQTPRPLREWMLNDLILVLSEIGWITVSAGAVGAVLREYRNYVHPQKQLANKLHLKPEDATLFWNITKSIARQLA